MRISSFFWFPSFDPEISTHMIYINIYFFSHAFIKESDVLLFFAISFEMIVELKREAKEKGFQSVTIIKKEEKNDIHFWANHNGIRCRRSGVSSSPSWSSAVCDPSLFLCLINPIVIRLSNAKETLIHSEI